MTSGAITWTLSPEAFSVGPFHIRYYGLMFCVAFLLASLVFLYMIRREGKPLVLLPVTLNAMFLGLLVGARAGECLFYSADYYFNHPLEIVFPFREGEFTGISGLSSHGAAIGCLIALLLIARSHKMRFVLLLDRVTVCCALAAVFIRIGNFMNSEIIGKPASHPWSVVFETLGENISRHPVQLYEATAYFTIFLILFFVYRNHYRTIRAGVLTGLFLLLIFSSRFFLEYLKEPLNDFDRIPGLNTGQYLSLPFIFAGFFILGATFIKAQDEALTQ
ncbi:MAG: prolipoprotein diacylglyceryl transferase [Prevotellaceae bacterium]|nr:prolipoprotein diacylglyceryl transferase [Prevotellaceae bacterium]